jgi:aspartyl protease family protein
MDGDTTARLIYLSLLLAAVAGPLFLSLRKSPGKTLQQLLIWVFIFVGFIAAYGLWPDLRSALNPSAGTVRNGKLELQVADDGHFYAELQVNGTPVTFLIDTGASDIVLSRQDAAHAGIDLASLSFWDQAETANGTVASAPVTLDSLTLGPWRDQDIAASVNGGDMRDSLLGMAYLRRFQLATSDGRLTLSR